MYSHTSLRSLLATGLLVCGSTVISAVRLRGEGHGPSSMTWPRCPNVWKDIGEELKAWFVDDEGLCSELAAQAIRLPFHDCFPSGGCDGSIILTDECTTRPENMQMIPICGVLYRMSHDYGVGAADLINFAASMANKACPWGPYIPFYIGRKDNATASTPGQIPDATQNAPTLVQDFQARNFSAMDLVALMGAHSAGGNLTFVPFDSTPGEMDSPCYYSEVLTGSAPAILFSDMSLALDPSTSAF